MAVISYLVKAQAELSREQLEVILADATTVLRETYMTIAEQLEEQGIQKGMQQGMQQGMRQTLMNQIRLKFGTVSDEASQRITAASAPELDVWIARVLTADNESELFR
jgi:flagellar biosynthesis/type III secretory pathway protein FliH